MPEAEEALTRTSYNVVADVYADHFRTTEGEQPIDLATIDHFVALLHEPRVVLDAGCGAGRMLPYLAGRGCHAEGIDLSPNMVRRARADHPDFTVAEEFLCPASSSWQDFLGFECRGGGVGQAQVHLLGPVP
ncbi:class I SAM-dependent methyltransferase [Kocuria sp. p3-SID1433]|uniref:methyltransferase domain-containing protein n=1 Tax=unclassified Kocuria TaxID=2649579 RepID=UPI0021A81012|nr:MULTISPECIES: class I SAM-dependent methyltransferase [unclassified Kocuria]MCT1602810.1 class I SAM-dependent methyltransferase [Kocuria sp. p3-SID1428]MCT2180787.1 class I SAM-dependent methyltransferase [Kocuria sp. p3-SID1433]